MLKLPLVIVIVLFFQCCGYNQEKFANYSIPLNSLIDSLNIDKNDLEIFVDKSDYKLTLKTKEIVVKEYPVVFGGNPVDDKIMEGDQCTPEGNFKIKSKYPHKSWSKFIWLDYPNDSSRINFSKAIENGTIPENANIGGEIGIHGVPEIYEYSIDLKYNWTLGCISLKNKEVDEIYAFVNQNTTVVIRK